MRNKILLFLTIFVFISLSCQNETKKRIEAKNSFDKGMQYFNSKKFGEAIVEFSNSLEFDPLNTETLYHRAVSNTLLNNFKIALDDLDKAIELNPNYAEAFYASGVIKLRLENKKGAFFDFDKACNLGYKDACKRLNEYFMPGEGKKYSNEEAYIKTLNKYDNALKNQPNNSELYYRRALAYVDLLMYDSAIIDYNRAIEMDKNYSEAYFGRAKVYSIKQNFQNANKDLDKSIELNPNEL